MLKYLSYNVSDAKYQPATLFLSLKPYKKDSLDEENCYGLITARNDNPDGLPKRTSCVIHVSRELLDDVSQCYFPGGYYINLFQLSNFDWLVDFKAQNIIASKYFRMKNEDVLKLIREGREVK